MTLDAPARPPSSLGTFIRERRRDLGLSQQQLADAAGLSQPRVSLLEMGGFSHLPPPEVMIRLATALDTPLSELLALAGYREVAS